MPTPDDFTGERFLPECTGEIWAEHWHRYIFAARHVAGKDVLDAACGEGYGAALLARSAKSVTGLDVDAPTVAAARAKYLAPGLRFESGSVAALPFADGSFDCAVSFETLEHLAEQQAMLAELRRVLRPDGVLIISSPNKVEYSEKRDFHNEFHVHELYEDEFRALLGRNFGAQRWYGQRLLFNSALWPLPAATGDAMNAEWIAVEASDRKLPPPMYFVALAAADESLLPAAAGVTLLADPDDAMYREYTLTVARARTLEHLVDERDRQLSLHDSRMQHLETLIAKREAIIAERDRQLSASAARAGTMEKLIAKRERLIVERDSQIEAANRLLAERERLLVERERLIAERDGQLAALNARIDTAEKRIVAREHLIVERDAQLVALNARVDTAEERIVAREHLIVERDGQLAVANDRLATLERLVVDRERIIVERDGQLAAVNARLATAEGLIAERERIIVERDGQLAALNARIAAAEALMAELAGRIAALEQDLAQRDQQLVQRAEHIEALNKTSQDLRDEVARRGGWRWWLALPLLRIRRMLSRTADASHQDGP
jgi:SAM-dependent methyltransferase